MKLDLGQIVSGIALAAVGAIFALVGNYLLQYYNDYQQNIYATKSARQIALYAARMVPRVFLATNTNKAEKRIALETCLKQLQSFPVDKLRPAEISEQIVDIEVVSQVAISWAQGKVELSKDEQADLVGRVEADVLKLG